MVPSPGCSEAEPCGLGVGDCAGLDVNCAGELMCSEYVGGGPGKLPLGLKLGGTEEASAGHWFCYDPAPTPKCGTYTVTQLLRDREHAFLFDFDGDKVIEAQGQADDTPAAAGPKWSAAKGRQCAVQAGPHGAPPPNASKK